MPKLWATSPEADLAERRGRSDLTTAAAAKSSSATAGRSGSSMKISVRGLPRAGYRCRQRASPRIRSEGHSLPQAARTPATTRADRVDLGARSTARWCRSWQAGNSRHVSFESRLKRTVIELLVTRDVAMIRFPVKESTATPNPCGTFASPTNGRMKAHVTSTNSPLGLVAAWPTQRIPARPRAADRDHENNELAYTCSSQIEITSPADPLTGVSGFVSSRRALADSLRLLGARPARGRRALAGDQTFLFSNPTVLRKRCWPRVSA